MEKREIPAKQATLCVIIDRARKSILLGMKNRGFGVGKYNGFGGKVNAGESCKLAAIRELYEESGLHYKSEHLIKVGEFDFIFRTNPNLTRPFILI